jgi:Asp-tRNA(Asn)/Glu-tRNA(Gln) amidotransferase A subunit family amidase
VLRKLANLVATRQIRPRALVELSLERIERHNPALNAVVASRADEALAEADALEARLAAGEAPGALCGIPCLVKDIEDVCGMRTTHGSLAFCEADPAARDGLVPGRLKAAGAIVVGKTNCPEFAYEGFTCNRLFGASRNPWATEWTTGGSSGGSAAALAAGLAPIATGTDGGGSVRIPAALCGIVGLKPTNGLIPRLPIPPWIDLSTDGPLGTSIDDVRLLLSLERGPVAGDPTALPYWIDNADRMPRRLLAAERFHDWGPLPDGIRRLFEASVVDLSTELGLPVEALDPKDLFPMGNPDLEWYTVCGVEHAYLLGGDFIRENADRFDPGFLAWMEEALQTSAAEYLEARRRRFDYVRRLDELLGDEAVLLTPTLAMEGLLADGCVPGAETPGAPAECYNTMVANLTGHPAVSLPAGTCANGIPFGLQLIAPRYADDMLLNVGALWERFHAWPQVAPGYEAFDVSCASSCVRTSPP